MARFLIPTGDRVFVRPDAANWRTREGLILPEIARDPPEQGEVVGVGVGQNARKTGARIPMTVDVGDRVIFHKYNGTELEVDGERLLVFREADIFAVVEE